MTRDDLPKLWHERAPDMDYRAWLESRVLDLEEDRARLGWLVTSLNVMGLFAAWCEWNVRGFSTSRESADFIEWCKRIDEARV